MSEPSQEILVQIDPTLKQTCPALALACVQGAVSVQSSDQNLIEKLNQRAAEIVVELPADKVAAQPSIAATRDAYRKLGKDPSRYRGSAEALLRRVGSGKGLYFINNIVDINNLLSLQSCLPAGSYDCSKLSDPVTFRAGTVGETYKGIGKDLLNLEHLPVFCDSAGPFGSPTSDSERAMITLSASRIAMMIIDFSGAADLKQWSLRAIELLGEHASGAELSYRVIV